MPWINHGHSILKLSKSWVKQEEGMEEYTGEIKPTHFQSTHLSA